MKSRKEGTQFLRWFGPLLDALRDLGGSGTPDEATDKVAELCKVPESQQNELMESGQPRFRNQVAWARFYLKRQGLLDSSTRGVWRLTDKGQVTHLTYAQAQDIFREQVRIDSAARKQKQKDQQPGTVIDTPEELDLSIAADYRDRLLAAIQALPFAGFERLCQRLLREAGFQQVAVTGRTGDNGIDGHGILELNAFVTFKVLFQCKRYKGSVGTPQIRDFRGAMEGRADKGIILTTGTFTQDAKREARRDGARPIELVDGDKLVDMFEKLELGLKPRTVFEVDDAFFEEFRK
ncbi:MAG: Mrr restriction system protein [Deltaproteobacteria bacterium]|nr:Mrr restriction system protein [Deltaproteobacteria bacterium]